MTQDFPEPVRYPWRTMEVGQTFLMPKREHVIRNAASRANRLYAPRRFSVRKQDGLLYVRRVA